MFAIASDDVEQVQQVLESGDADPNDCLGPQSALAFTLTNDKLTKKLDIVKTLLAYGADPATAKKLEPSCNPPAEGQTPQASTVIDGIDLATRYYVDRADAAHTQQSSALIHRSLFRPLTRVRYELIGQDRALEQLFRVLSMHSRELAIGPIVVMLCGKLAFWLSSSGADFLMDRPQRTRKESFGTEVWVHLFFLGTDFRPEALFTVGSLLDMPTHTVNMTTLRSTHDIWQSYSMSPYEVTTL